MNIFALYSTPQMSSCFYKPLYKPSTKISIKEIQHKKYAHCLTEKARNTIEKAAHPFQVFKWKMNELTMILF